MNRMENYPREVKLVGGYNCCITVEEENQWYEHITIDPVWEKWQKVKMDDKFYLQHGVFSYFQGDYEEFRVHTNKVSRELYEKGKAWYEALVEEEAQTKQLNG